MAYSTTEQLLSRVSDIHKKYNAISKISGEKFNIFHILKISARETGTHSALLAELLNPSGSHGYGDLFLQIFLQQQQKKHSQFNSLHETLKTFDSTSAQAIPEKHIGFLSADGTEGGRMDILLCDRHNNAIVFENKVHAKDQNWQLVRYNKAYPSAPIFYLTLYGESPSTNSSGHLQEGMDYVCISYKDDVLDWLSACVKEASSHPLLRETIVQYVHLIKHLTNQSSSIYMEREIANLLCSSKENILAAYSVRGSIDKMEDMLTQKLLKELKGFADSTGLLCEFPDDFGRVAEDREVDFYVSDQNDMYICLGFEGWRKDFSIGISAERIDPIIKDKIISSQIVPAIGHTSSNPHHAHWYYLHYYEDRKMKIWDNPEIWCEIAEGTLGKELCRQIAFIVQELKNIGVIVPTV